jgi:hypothetical protein
VVLLMNRLGQHKATAAYILCAFYNLILTCTCMCVSAAVMSQARMDVEPLVRLESRLTSLEPLAAGLPALRLLPFICTCVLLLLPQARMDVEPLVRLELRLVSLEPLAAGLPQLTRLVLADATFTREPWALSQLAWLKGLRGLVVAWDTGLWAPGQVLQEGEALQVRCCCCCC